MKKTHLLILLSMLLLPQYLLAKPIGSAQALRNAQDFLRTKGIPFTPSGIRRAPMADVPGDEAPYYVFNLGGNGIRNARELVPDRKTLQDGFAATEASLSTDL